MPKQLYKITQFHGGLNSNSDARDIAENELSEATDIMVDELGKIRMMGGYTTVTSDVAAITPGYGLFQFSHDRVGGNAGGEHLNETDFATHAKWDVVGKAVDSGGNITFTFGLGSLDGTATQTAANRRIKGAESVAYVFTYTIAVTIAPNFFTLTLDSFSSESTALPFTDGTHSVTFTSASNVQSASFTITGTDDVGGTTTQGVFTIDNVSLRVYNAAETGDDYLAMADTDGAAAPDGGIDIYSATDNKWNSAIIHLGTTTGMKPCFYYVDGALRVGDGNFNNTNQWYGYIKRTLFSGLTSELVLDGWYIEDQEIKAGTVGDADQEETNYATFNNPVLTDGAVSLSMTANKTDTGGMRGFKNYYYSLIYDGVQESKLFRLPPQSGSATYPSDDVYENSTKKYQVYVNAEEFTGATNAGINKRTTGARIYWKSVDSTHAAYGEAYLLLIVDFVQGVRSPLANTFSAFADHGVSAEVCVSTAIEFTDEPRTETYRSRTGYSEDVVSIAAQYKTAVIANRIAYIANIKAKSKSSPDTAVVQGDAMIKSPVNQFDVFPASRILEVTVRDGDEIVKLEEYADRILQFKKNKMHLINISQEVEFLEDTFMHKGVSHPAATCKTDFGIAWVNQQGCYLYDGQKVNNLLEKQGRQIIKESEWSDFVDEPMIGYIPKKRQIIVADDTTTTGDGAVYLYDIVTQSWVKGTAATIPDQAKTNFVIDSNGDLIFGHTSDTGTIVRWDDTVDASSYVNLETKDIDFGQPGQLKNIYKVYLTYRGVGTHVRLHYGVDGLPPTLTFNSITSGTDGSSTGSGTAAKSIPYDAGVTDWLKAELKPSAAIRNINSFRLKISADQGSNNISSDFEINDITIVFRLKGQR